MQKNVYKKEIETLMKTNRKVKKYHLVRFEPSGCDAHISFRPELMLLSQAYLPNYYP